MEMISGMIFGTASGAVSGRSAVRGAEEEIKTRRTEEVQEQEKKQDDFLRPVKDEYIPEKSEPKRAPEICRGSTDKVDREIEKLKKEKEKLQQQIRSETDETKIKELERKLSQVERELNQKDNDAYRRQHSVFS